MNRTIVTMATLAACMAAAPVTADNGDNSMSVLTGDSYAYFEQGRIDKFHVDVRLIGTAPAPAVDLNVVAADEEVSKQIPSTAEGGVL